MMDDESKENLSGDAGEEDKRTAWQRNKEELYDKVPLTLRQLDIIIALGLLGLAVVAVLIFLEASGIL